MTNLTQQIVDLTLGSVNVALVVLLIGIGVILKHALKNFNNNTIPIVMISLGVVFAVLMNVPFDPQKMLLTYCVQGIASGYCAIIIHGKSKEIYNDFVNDNKLGVPANSEDDKKE